MIAIYICMYASETQAKFTHLYMYIYAMLDEIWKDFGLNLLQKQLNVCILSKKER